MLQQFKSIYLMDPETDATQKNVTLAFGEKDTGLYAQVKNLSSVEVREILGSGSANKLERTALDSGYSLNAYCLKLLRDALTSAPSKQKQIKLVDPIHTTFRGGLGDPLHGWYPYLEGYSPDFVTAIMDRYMPEAQSIYDPFSGSGTTPIAAALREVDSYYSEVNPVLQVVSEAKMSARKLLRTQRKEVVQNLMKLATELDTLLADVPEDEQLDLAHHACFGKSVFFDGPTYHEILKLRTFIDALAGTSSETSRFLLVAVLRALVPASLLQRAGDLRYKTQRELDTKKVPLLTEVKSNLKMIAEDLSRVASAPIKPVFITENAKNIGKLTPLKIDGVITSPPYLNGTNYFRNTKLELWFIRGISVARDLTAYRAKAITAGINDVTNRSEVEDLSENLQKLVKELNQKAYDQRIPKMVHYYFIDMLKVFRGLKKHLNNKSVIAIDIGDSVYSDVHVPTDVILKDLLESEGYHLTDEVLLRKRTSRSGQTLKQVLLVFEYKHAKKQKEITSKLEVWEDFKIRQQHHDLPFSKRNWGHPLHSLCSYQGKMKPSLAFHLVKSFTRPGDKMLDPFVGVGTIPFEGALNGVQTYGFDISPAALIISQAKLGKIDPAECERILQELEGWLEKQSFSQIDFTLASGFGYNRKLAEYYNEKTLGEILSARNYFKSKRQLSDNDAIVMSSLLHILHGNRPYALSRRSHSITPFAPTGGYEYRALMPRLRAKVDKSLTGFPTEDGYVPGKMFFQDVTTPWPAEVDRLDSIITSPPFFDSTRFYQANWLRLWFAGWNDEDFKLRPKIFIDEKQKKSFDVYEAIFRQSRERLKLGGHLVLHLGKSKKSDMAYELAQRAKPWFRVVDIFSENVEHTESHGIRDKGTVVEHQYLVLS